MNSRGNPRGTASRATAAVRRKSLHHLDLVITLTTLAPAPFSPRRDWRVRRGEDRRSIAVAWMRLLQPGALAGLAFSPLSQFAALARGPAPTEISPERNIATVRHDPPPYPIRDLRGGRFGQTCRLLAVEPHPEAPGEWVADQLDAVGLTASFLQADAECGGQSWHGDLLGIGVAVIFRNGTNEGWSKTRFLPRGCRKVHSYSMIRRGAINVVSPRTTLAEQAMRPLMDVSFALAVLGSAVLLLIILKVITSDRPIRQFSVREMLLFVSICAVWLSQIAVSPLTSRRDRMNYSPHDLVVGFVWLVLAVFYWRRLLRAPLALHTFGPLFLAASVIVCRVADGGHISIPETCWQLSVGAFMSSFVSLPFAVMIVMGLFGTRFHGKSNAVINEQPQSPPSDQPSADG